MQADTTKKSISLIGMAAAGKTTLGRVVAECLGFAHVDADWLISAHFGCHLQQIVDELGDEDFLQLEEETLCKLSINRAVISTGGSVVYSEKIMQHLHSLGPVIAIDPGFETIEKRIQAAPDRGLVIAPGQTLFDLYSARRPLYESTASFFLHTRQGSIDDHAEAIIAWLKTQDIV